jgi:FKBP-type peptidyl-prolyl cis-trans isomerase SlyD
MQINKQKVVTIDYVLTNNDGEIIDRSSNGNFSYLHGAGNIIPGLEEALENKQTGDEVTVTVEPEQAYGVRNEALQQTVSRDMFDDGTEISVGQQFHAETPNGDPLIVTVVEVNGDDITLDGNHPLANETLNFSVQIISVREATEDELSHGHAHGDGGHQH